MTIKTECGACGRSYQVDESLEGRRLKCKTCGELFVVGEEPDELDTISRPTERTLKKKKKKKGKSSKKLFTLIAVITSFVVGIGGLGYGGYLLYYYVIRDSPQKVIADMIDVIEDFVEILEEVKDVPTANSAVPKIKQLGDRLVRMKERFENVSEEAEKMTLEQREKIEEKFRSKMTDATSRMTNVMAKLRNNAAVLAILQEPMISLQHRMTEATLARNKAKNDAQMEELRKMHERNMEMARQNQNPFNPNPNNPFMPIGQDPVAAAEKEKAQWEVQFGSGKVTLIVIRKLALNMHQDIFSRCRELSTNNEHGGQAVNDLAAIVVVGDATAISKAIDFGKVISVSNGRIEVEYDVNYRYVQGAGPKPQ